LIRSILILFLLSGLLFGQTSKDSCLTAAQNLARNPNEGLYRPFYSCAISQAETKKDSLHIYYEVGRKLIRSIPQEAHPLLDTAILLSTEDDIRMGRSWQYKAYMYEVGGQFFQAEHAYKQALDNYERNQASPKRQAGCAKSLGNIYTRYSDYEKAIHYLQKAVNGYQEAEAKPQLAMSLSDLARAYYWQGEVAEANKQAKSVLKISPLSDLELGLAKDILGTCLFHQKYDQQGLQVTREAIRHFLNIGYAAAAAAGYRSLGDTYLNMGEVDSAKSCYQQAWLQSIEAYGNQHRREVGQWHLGWGKIQSQKGNHDEALQAYQQALYQCMPTVIDTSDISSNFPKDQIIRENVLIQALEGKAKSWIEKYKGKPDGQFLRHAIDALDLLYAIEDKFRKSYDFESSRLIVGALRHPRVEMSLWAINKLGKEAGSVEKAFGYVESSKALGLLEELKNDQSRQSILPDSIVFQLNAREKKIQLLARDVASAPTEEDRTQHESLRVELATFVETLEKSYPDYYQFKYDYTTIEPAALLASLASDQTFVEYFHGEKALYAFKVSSSGLEFFELELPDSAALTTLEHSLHASNLMAVSPAQYAAAAYKLHQQLLAPLGELSPRLTIVPDRALARIPFDALIAQQTVAPKTWRELPFLIHDRSIAYAWSATLLSTQQAINIEREGILSISPVHFEKLPHLIAGQAIGPHLQGLWSQTQLFQEAEATKRIFLQQVQNSSQAYQIINLYTHAKADSSSPGRSWISFRDDQPDALLYLNELYHLQLNAQLAVLGACETGIGKEYRGEGLMSFARGFTYAGCQSILSTLWSSDEQATASLLKSFFTKLEGGASKDLALADSKRDYLAASSERRAIDYHPRQWASLMIIGDSRGMKAGGFAWWWVLVPLLAGGLIYWRIKSRQ
jgi:CHAT domain-containing protein